jgi:class 3 adenylate cyclase
VRLILMDPRGLGMSDRLTETPSLEERVADMLAVLDAAGSGHATLFGSSDTGPACIAAATAHPERVDGLILLGTYARIAWSEDYPFGAHEEDFADFENAVKNDWGTAERLSNISPSTADDPAFQQWATRLMQVGASPRAVVLLAQMTRKVDVRDRLADVAVPTLVMHRAGDRLNSIEHGRYLANRIAGAKFVELPGEDFVVWAGDTDVIVDEIEEFMTGHRSGLTSRVVATLMYTDVVGSTEQARLLGDERWSNLVELHNSRVRAELRRFDGHEIDTAGDGFLAWFESPSSSILCAQAVLRSVGEIGLKLRIGIHAGECDVLADRLRGIALHIGSRVGAAASADEILVSQTVKDLVAGSRFQFKDRGPRQMKGVPDEWHVYSVS